MTRTKGATKVVARNKAARCLELHLAGANAKQIAAEVGYKEPKSVERIIRQELRKMAAMKKDLPEHLALQLERCNRFLLIQWPAAQAGDRDAIRMCLDIMRQIDLYAGAAGIRYQGGGFDNEGNPMPGGVQVSGGAVFVIGGVDKNYLTELDEMATKQGLPPASKDLSHIEGMGPGSRGESVKRDIANAIDARSWSETESTPLQDIIDAKAEMVNGSNGDGNGNHPEPPSAAPQAPENDIPDVVQCSVFVRALEGDQEHCKRCARTKPQHR